MYDSFTPSCAQFGFQSDVSVQQALLQAQTNSQQDLTHIALLDLAKAYDRFDRKKLLNVLATWLDPTTLLMVRAMVGPMVAHIQGDTTN